MRRWPPPLRFSIPGVLLGIGVVVLAASVRYELAAADVRAEAAITQRAQLLSLVLSAQLERSYRERRPSDARNDVLQASADRALQRAILFDEHRRAVDGMPLGVSGRTFEETAFVDDVPLLDEMRATGSTQLRIANHGDHLNSYVPLALSHGDELLPKDAGVLAMQFDLRPIRSEERVLVMWRAIGLALALAAVAAMLWLFFQFSLLRRVNALITATRQFAAGDLNARTGLQGSDELVHLSRAFDQMAEAIAVHRQALVEAEHRSSFLANVSQDFAAAFDTDEPLYALAKLVVPVVGEACFVHVSDQPRVAVAHVDANLEAILQRHADSALGGALLVAIESGETQLSPRGGAPLADAFGPLWPQDAESAGLLPERGAYIVVPLRARDRTVGVIAFVARDVSRYEDPKLRVLAEDLARRAALQVDNARLYRQTQEAVRMRDEFLTVAAHELRTPTTSLRLAVDLLCRSPPEARAQRMLELLSRDSQRLASLVDRLLDVSRIMAAQMAVVLEPVDLTLAVKEVAGTLASTLERSGTKLTVETGGPIIGQWDLTRVQQVVTNLLVNAIKYGRGRPIRVRAEQSGDMAKLTVEDHGIGIAPENQATIFGRFERAVSSRHYGGLGLGLYIVRRIVEALGGTIQLTSELDVGSTFVIELPLAGPKVVSS